MTRGEVAEGQGQEGGEASVKDGWSYVHHSLDCPLLTRAPGNQEGVADVDRVVHAEADTEYDVDAGDDVDSDVPVVKKANDVSETDGDHEDDHETDLDIAEEEERDDDHSSDGQAKVTPQLGTLGRRIIKLTLSYSETALKPSTVRLPIMMSVSQLA